MKTNEEISREAAFIEHHIGPWRAEWYAKSITECGDHSEAGLWKCRFREVVLEYAREVAKLKADLLERAESQAERREKRQGEGHMSEPFDSRGFSVGDAVSKVGGDYRFDGVVVAAFAKRSGLVRYVVEDDRGILHIFSSRNLERAEAAGK